MKQDFYGEIIDELLHSGTLTRQMRILVVCGGPRDRTVLRKRGFEDVVISNVDPRPSSRAVTPFTWSYQNAEKLTFADDSFDFCLVHSGLHHCRSPHRAMVEMYRVARHGLLLFEPYDNFITRVGVRLRVGQEYEHASVAGNDLEHGGVGNSPVPNYVYRWTEREIVKTISSYAPEARTQTRFFHRMRVPWNQLRHRRNPIVHAAVRLAQPALRAIEVCFPRQANNFAALVIKPRLPEGLHPWLRQDGTGVRLNEQWIHAQYPRGRRPVTQAPARR